MNAQDQRRGRERQGLQGAARGRAPLRASVLSRESALFRQVSWGAAPVRCLPEGDPSQPVGAPDADELESDDLEVDDLTIDESALPELDREDAEAPVREPGYDDLLDRGWLERAGDDDPDDDTPAVDDVGLTIELDSPAADDEGAEVVDLDVGSLLTSLPSEGAELDLDTLAERADPSLGLGALRDLLLPEDDDELDDEAVGDDDRFPAFDDDAERSPQPSADDDSDPDGLT